MTEHDALRKINAFPLDDVAPKVLHFEEFVKLETLALVTEWVDGELLSSWLERADELALQERLAVFHRVAFAMSTATRDFQHRDFHPGNIILLPEDFVKMGPYIRGLYARSGVKVLDWGEALPVIFGNYDDEPDHNFVMLAYAPRVIAGALTSLPPEVFSPWDRNSHFGGIYESWGLGMLLYRVLTLKSLSVPAGIGDYASQVHSGVLRNMIEQGTDELAAMDLPGGRILPRLFRWMMEQDPAKRADISDIGRVMWDLRYEELRIADNSELEKYFTDPRRYEPAAGWQFSGIPDYD
ncbi:protein kinase-like protein [Cupriavidus alkaliphilus]|nr:protein kinase-like protein [Cupriavidus alkaliphilus]